MLTTFVAGFALGLAVQIPPVGGGNLQVPPIKVGPPKTYLVSAGKPVLLVPVPYPAGPLAMPSGPITFPINLDGNVVRWLQATGPRPFDATLIQVDALGKTLTAYDIKRTALSAVSFQTLARATGGSGVVRITLTPGAAIVNKTATLPVGAFRSEPQFRVLGFNLTLGGKAAPWVDRILPFIVSLSGTELRSDWTVEMSLNQPPSNGPATNCRLALRLQALARPEVNLNLDFKANAISAAGPRRANFRLGSIAFR